MGLEHPRRARLKHRADYQRVYRDGRSARHALVVLFHAPSALGATAPTRVGITVSRRVDKRATRRNRIRRVWGEAVRLSGSRLAPGHDIVLNARRANPSDLNTPAARKVLLELAAQEGLLLPEDPGS